MLTHQYEDLNNQDNLLIAFEFSKKENQIWKKKQSNDLFPKLPIKIYVGRTKPKSKLKSNNIL